MSEARPMKLGINGLGRIGRLSLWYHVSKRTFSGMVSSIGHHENQGQKEIGSAVERDRTYSRPGSYLYRYKYPRVVENLEKKTNRMSVDEAPVTVLGKGRAPGEINRQEEHDVKLVAGATGALRDPTEPLCDTKASLRGHPQAGLQRWSSLHPLRPGTRRQICRKMP